MSKKDDNETGDTVSADQTPSTRNRRVERRGFLKAAGVGGGGVLLGTIIGKTVGKSTGRDLFAENALGMVVGDPNRCVGCRRCELACSEFNDGKAQPSIARIKVARNYNFGPRGVQLGYRRGEGRFGNHRITQDTCRQCPHPVPCQSSCRYDAIEVTPPVNARKVNKDKCQGCRICQRACPWGMPSFDEDLERATKCHLCNGEPECVNACPAGALKYVPWKDRTNDAPRI